MQKHCVIFAGRPVSLSMRRYVAENAFIIGADKGYLHAAELGFFPDLVLGDFDSSPVPQTRAEQIVLPAQKDDTDTFYAVKFAVQQRFTSVTILGGTGGRQDHTFANLQALQYLAAKGVENLLADEESEIRCITNKRLVLPAVKDSFLSVYAVGGPASGVCLEGVKYPLSNALLLPDIPLGTSNKFTQKEAVISCSDGFLLVMLCHEEPK